MDNKNVIKIHSFTKEVLFGLLYGLGFFAFITALSWNNASEILFLLFIFFVVIIGYNLKMSISTLVIEHDKFYMKSSLLYKKIQSERPIYYKEVSQALFDTIDLKSNEGSKSTNQNVKMNLIFSRYSSIKCLTFIMQNGDKHQIVINNYSKRQIENIIDELKKRGIIFESNISEQAFIYHHSNQKEEPFENKKVKYPLLLKIITALGMFIFFFFAYYSNKHGGSAIQVTDAAQIEGYISGHYYLVSHGIYTEVSYTIYQRMKILEPIMFISFFLMFISNFIYLLISRKRLLKG